MAELELTPGVSRGRLRLKDDTPCCPTCGRKYSAPRSTGNSSKDLAVDLAKAKFALECLKRAMYWPNEDQSFYTAVVDEFSRLSRALLDHRLLWAIYRRSSKGEPYYQVQVQQEVA